MNKAQAPVEILFRNVVTGNRAAGFKSRRLARVRVTRCGEWFPLPVREADAAISTGTYNGRPCRLAVTNGKD
jgi:hypothetical protein